MIAACNGSTNGSAFDKMCGCALTLGLESPRRPKRLPVVLSQEEIMRLLEAAPSLRDKLLLGLMYATGARVSEAVRLRWRDFDFDETLVARLESTDLYKSARRGILPPGVNSKTWFDEDHAWAYGMSVYAPSLSNAAAKAGREMRDSQILQPVNGGDKPSAQQPGGFTDEKGTDVKRPSKVVKPGPTGKIEPEEK